MHDFKWSKTEKKVAKAAFEKAYQRECSDVIEKIRTKVKKVTEPDNIWRLHDYLTEKWSEIDGKYDYRYSKLILVFVRLINEGWLDYSDLESISKDKIDRMKTLINFRNE